MSSYDRHLGIHPVTGDFDVYVYVVEKMRLMVTPVADVCPSMLVQMLWQKAEAIVDKSSQRKDDRNAEK